MAGESVDVGASAPANEGAVAAAVTDAGQGGNQPPANGAVAAAAEPRKSQDPWAPGAQIDIDMMKVWEKHNPLRADDGKFAPAQEPTDQSAKPLDEAAAPTPADQPKDAKVEQGKPAIDPPLSWSADMKAKWAALPPELQTYVAQRDKETHDAITQSGQRLKTFEQQIKANEPLDQLIAAHKDEFAKRGVTPAQGFAVLLNAQRSLDANPAAALIQIGLGYGIDLRPAFQGMPAQQVQQSQPDPAVAELKNELTELKKWRSDREANERASAQRDGESIISKFSSEKDKDGNLLHPHFMNEEVQDYICLLVQSGKIAELPDSKAKLEAAYDQAVHALPNIRQRIQEDQRKADEAKRTAETKVKADEARKSNSVNVRSAPASANPKTMDDTLKQIAMKAYPGWRPHA